MKDLALHLAYVGSETYHQAAQVDLNPGIYADGWFLFENLSSSSNSKLDRFYRNNLLMKDLALSTSPSVGSETLHQAAQVDLNPGIYADGGNRTNLPLFTSLIEYESIGTASYQALQVGIEKQLSAGLQLQSNFTWAKTIDLLSGSTDFLSYPS